MERKLTADIRRLGARPLSHEIPSRYLQFDPEQMQSFCGQVALKITAMPATAETQNNVSDVVQRLLSYHSFFLFFHFFGIWGSLVSRNQRPGHSIRTRVLHCQQYLYKFKGLMQKQIGKCLLRVHLIMFVGGRPPEPAGSSLVPCFPRTCVPGQLCTGSLENAPWLYCAFKTNNVPFVLHLKQEHCINNPDLASPRTCKGRWGGQHN